MPNPCRVCVNPAWAEQTRIWVAEGVSDREIARRLGADKSTVNRHRLNHIIAPLQHQPELVNKFASTRQTHEQLAAAAASDALSVVDWMKSNFGVKAQAEKTLRVDNRLERAAALAEASGSPNAIATLAMAQLRAIETGAKFAQLPGFVPRASVDQVGGAAPRFAVNIVFSGAGRTETITLGPATSTSDGGRERDPRAVVRTDFTPVSNVVEADFAKTNTRKVNAASDAGRDGGNNATWLNDLLDDNDQPDGDVDRDFDEQD